MSPSAAAGYRARDRARDQIGARPGLLAREAAYRLARAARERLLERRYASLTRARGAGLRPLSLEPLPPVSELPASFAEGASAVREYAHAAAEHRFTLLGSGPVEHGKRIDWHRDPLSGFRWPAADYLAVRAATPPGADPKFPWELSRCHHFLALARAANLFEEPVYLDALSEQWRSWIDANPPGIGINWANAMEVGVRAVNWSWTIAELGGTARLPGGIGPRIAESLERHGRHLRWNLEGTPRLRSNHFLGNALGLLAIGAALTGPAPAGWVRFARRSLEREIQLQIHPDGTGFEASTSYQGLALEVFLIAQLILESTGDSFSSAYRDRLARAAAASLALRHPDGRMPRFGDADDSRVLPLDDRRVATHDNLLVLASAVVGSAVPGGLEARDRAEAAFVLPSRLRASCLAGVGGKAPALGAAARRSFPDGGLYVIDAPRAHLVLRCGGVGQNGNGGHAHNDLLSFELSLDGRPLVVDPGSSTYRNATERTRSRSTFSHSTLAVDGEEINPFDPAHPFALRGRARPGPVTLDRKGSTSTLTCSHDGYSRLDPPVICRRVIRVEGDGVRIVIEDRVEPAPASSGSRRAAAQPETRVVSRLQLAPGVGAVPTIEGPGCLRLRSADLTVLLRSDASLRPTAGWVASSYGKVEDAVLVEASRSGPLPLRIVTTIELERSDAA